MNRNKCLFVPPLLETSECSKEYSSGTYVGDYMDGKVFKATLKDGQIILDVLHTDDTDPKYPYPQIFIDL